MGKLASEFETAIRNIQTLLQYMTDPQHVEPTSSLRGLERWNTVLNDYLNLLEMCCATHTLLKARVDAIRKRLHEVRLFR